MAEIASVSAGVSCFDVFLIEIRHVCMAGNIPNYVGAIKRCRF